MKVFSIRVEISVRILDGFCLELEVKANMYLKLFLVYIAGCYSMNNPKLARRVRR